MYETARKYLASSSDIPRDFGQLSLAELDGQLRAESCSPVALHLLARHGARTPSAKKTKKLAKLLEKLQKKLAKGGKVKAEAKACVLAAVASWRPRFSADQDELLTLRGQLEEAAIARRFMLIYPDLLMADLRFWSSEAATSRHIPDQIESPIKVKVTGKLRTAQTALAFVQALQEPQLVACSGGQLERVPSNDANAAGYNPEAIKGDKCYLSMAKHQLADYLKPQKLCKKFKVNKRANKELIGEAREALARRLGAKIAAKLGLRAEALDWDTVDAIAATCHYEAALGGLESPWCWLLDRADLEAYDYFRDLKSYLKRVHGSPLSAAQACPLMKHLKGELASELVAGSGGRKRVRLSFYHSGSVKRLLAALGLFRDERSYSTGAVSEFIGSGLAAGSRQWRGGLAVPFSGNQAFVVYRCPGAGAGAGARLRLVVAVNERPVKLAACSRKPACELSEFLAALAGFGDCASLPGCGAAPGSS